MAITPCYNSFLESVVSLCSDDTAPACHSRTAAAAITRVRNETVAGLERWRLQGGGVLHTHLVSCRGLDAMDASLLLVSCPGQRREVTLGHGMSGEAAVSREGRQAGQVPCWGGGEIPTRWHSAGLREGILQPALVAKPRHAMI